MPAYKYDILSIAMTDGIKEEKIIPPEDSRPETGTPELAPPREREVTPEAPESAPPAEPAPATEEKERGTKPAPPPPSKIKPIPQVRDEVTIKIEKILENGLSESYQRLSPVAQQEFKLKGEQAAVKIRELLGATHVKVKKIFRLILDWLKMLPGVNRFFLEQEAKIKTDRIIALKK